MVDRVGRATPWGLRRVSGDHMRFGVIGLGWSAAVLSIPVVVRTGGEAADG